MANITDVVALRFLADRIRPLADLQARLYYEASRVQDEWNAQSMSARIPNTADNLIETRTDGVRPVTAAEATAIITRAGEFVTDYDQTSKAKLNTVLKVAVHTD